MGKVSAFFLSVKFEGSKTGLYHTGKSDFIKDHLKNFSKIYGWNVRKFPI